MPRGTRDPRDLAVGKRARAFRIKAGLSQEEVGERLGVTFQQIQKYEAGTNRIAASRLDEMARLFKIPVSAFFGSDSKSSGLDISFISNRSRAAIIETLERINNPRIEARLNDLLQELAKR